VEPRNARAPHRRTCEELLVLRCAALRGTGLLGSSLWFRSRNIPPKNHPVCRMHNSPKSLMIGGGSSLFCARNLPGSPPVPLFCARKVKRFFARSTVPRSWFWGSAQGITYTPVPALHAGFDGCLGFLASTSLLQFQIWISVLRFKELILIAPPYIVAGGTWQALPAHILSISGALAP
jgi:hypothetical protein